MATITLAGDLRDAFYDFVDCFIGGYARVTGTAVTSSSGYPFAGSLTGGGLVAPLTGDIFLKGSISGLELQYGEIVDISRPIQFTTVLTMDSLALDAEQLFSFAYRTTTASYGLFQQNYFAREIDPDRVVLTGSDGDDSATPNPWVQFRGADRFVMGAGDDAVDAGAGNDVVLGGTGADVLEGGAGRDRLKGGAGADVLKGDGGHDLLFGGAGGDRIAGGAGDDVLWGQGGRNVLTGGKGRDVFVFGGGHDRVTDFADDVDTLRLDDALWSGGLGKRQVLRQFAEEIDGGVTFDFGSGAVLRLAGVADRMDLLDDLVLV